MTDSDIAALRTWATAHAPAGSLQAKQVLELLAERDAVLFALIPLTEFLRRLDVAGPAAAPETARIGIALTWTEGLTLGQLRAILATMRPPQILSDRVQ